jgi:hypothetical protein
MIQKSSTCSCRLLWLMMSNHMSPSSRCLCFEYHPGCHPTWYTVGPNLDPNRYITSRQCESEYGVCEVVDEAFASEPPLVAQYLGQQGNWRNPWSILSSILPLNCIRQVGVPQMSTMLTMSSKAATSEQEFLFYVNFWILMRLSTFESWWQCWRDNDDDIDSFLNHRCGEFGLSRDRFDDITSALRFSSKITVDDTLSPVRDFIYS